MHASGVDGQAVTSIHAPTKAQQPQAARLHRLHPASIHASSKSATNQKARWPCQHRCFNPRAREGRDLSPKLTCYQPPHVSTHAPARGATGSFTIKGSFSEGFNPCAHEGRDDEACAQAMVWQGFNPRAREGRDGRGPHVTPRARLFQPTRPRGARPGNLPSTLFASHVSTHAPARGATCPAHTGSTSKPMFQSTRLRGRDANRPRSPRRPCGFNPRARGGATLWHKRHAHRRPVSIHTPAEGATGLNPYRNRDCVVSIHTPAGGATAAG